MCGIAGIIDPTLDPVELQSRLAAMQARLRHRGPDDQGLYVDAPHGAGLAHTRLSILDLSPAGAQPMHADEGRYTITFNGEIYNFEELRKELVAAGVPLKSRSDTEVILEMYRREGEACVERFVGMFAFAIWDRRERRCFLAPGRWGSSRSTCGGTAPRWLSPRKSARSWKRILGRGGCAHGRCADISCTAPFRSR